jgi:hypothetical protein
MKLTILDIDYHRYGIAGAPFHAIIFQGDLDTPGIKLGVVFDQKWHTAVLDIGKLGNRDIRFGSNSWRGDQYEPALRKAIADHQTREEANSHAQ